WRGHNRSCWRGSGSLGGRAVWVLRCLFSFERLAGSFGIRLGLGRGLGRYAAVLRDILLVLGIGLGKHMAFAGRGALGDDVEIIVGVGIGDRPKRIDARIGDRRRRQAVDLVGIIGRLRLDLGSTDAAVELGLALGDAIDDGGVGLQAHAFAQPIDEDCGHLGTFAGDAGFLLDDGGEDEQLLGRFE